VRPNPLSSQPTPLSHHRRSSPPTEEDARRNHSNPLSAALRAPREAPVTRMPPNSSSWLGYLSFTQATRVRVPDLEAFATLHTHPHTPRTPKPTLTSIFHLLASWRATSAHHRRIRWPQGLPTTRYTPPSTECGVRRGGQLVSHPSAKHSHHDMSTRHVRRGPPSLWDVVPSLLGVHSGLLSLRTTPHPSATASSS
jgi:hypothetical protein